MDVKVAHQVFRRQLLRGGHHGRRLDFNKWLTLVQIVQECFESVGYNPSGQHITIGPAIACINEGIQKEVGIGGGKLFNSGHLSQLVGPLNSIFNDTGDGRYSLSEEELQSFFVDLTQEIFSTIGNVEELLDVFDNFLATRFPKFQPAQREALLTGIVTVYNVDELF
eukprot:CAMPEP_0178766540 /NCGR_PEP_ID=MMETSP0744-20121128/19123_1 /TAXON_ID=913974 /ORGANISM="Nitzschia punctata, Strain CCMP561" /LENGTH=166 /DNA_ID=CAMNT_0020422277 /DNA_START=752 /DNA_END=1252 /DNA_ORIENTATION=+